MEVMTTSCGGTRTQWDTTENPDNFPDHALLHDQVRELQRSVNELTDELEAWKLNSFWARLRWRFHAALRA